MINLTRFQGEQQSFSSHDSIKHLKFQHLKFQHLKLDHSGGEHLEFEHSGGEHLGGEHLGGEHNIGLNSHLLSERIGFRSLDLIPMVAQLSLNSTVVASSSVLITLGSRQ